MKIRRFIPEDDEILRTDWANYVPADDIAKKLDHSIGTIRQRVLRLGLRRNKAVTRALQWAPPHLAIEREKMGDRAFLDAAYAWRKEQAIKLKRKYRKTIALQSKKISENSSLSRDEKIYEKRKLDIPMTKIAAEFGLTYQRVQQIVQRMKLGIISGPIGRPRGSRNILPENLSPEEIYQWWIDHPGRKYMTIKATK